ncbi:hypothetical protein [Haliovirga abyssi]|uniref:EpsG family protein n=1 Tax=Haliovirga abyssi TaxID=2996794 RepID=A0AAU9E0I4_9FUSO|nr:hypothetical protein [Haliovirga abyssi]BDU51410.1 hypothetical protein HLVA_19790 [Haliovirga abyssi]
MIVFIGFLLLLLYRVSKDKKRTIIYTLIFSFIINCIFLIFFTINSKAGNVYGVLGSDDLFYFENAIDLVKNPQDFFHQLNSFAGGYIVFCFLILYTSFIKIPLIISIVNISIYLNILYIIYWLLKEFKFKNSRINLIMFMLSINGFLIYTNIRILKDVLLFYLVLEIYYQFLNKKRGNFLVIFLLLIFMNYIRPYSTYLMFFLLLLQNQIKKIDPNKIIKKEKYFIILGIIFIGVFYFIFKEQVDTTIRVANLTALNDAEKFGSTIVLQYINAPLYKKIIVGIIRFILLPIPIGILFSKDAIVYKILAISGSCIWWLIMYNIFYNIVMSFNRKRYQEIYLLILFSFSFVLVYVIIYLGNAEPRLRYPMYITGTIIALGRKIEEKKIRRINVLFLIMINLSMFLVVNYLQFKRG